jgi:hypothetical protein
MTEVKEFVQFEPSLMVPPLGKNTPYEISEFGQWRIELKPGANTDLSAEDIKNLKKFAEMPVLLERGAIKFCKGQKIATPSVSLGDMDETQAIAAVVVMNDVNQLKAVAIEQSKLKRAKVADAANRRIKEIQDGKTGGDANES